MTFNKVMFSSATDHWSTPKDVYDALDKEFHFDFDPCPLNSKQDNLYKIWEANSVFVNPPYSNIKLWAEACYHNSEVGTTVVMLIPSRTDTRWWHDYVMKATEIRFIKGRLKFDDQENPAPFPSCIAVFEAVIREEGI